jgi:ferric-dicitrate binding protein FerR (iron transport regulator)
MSQDAPNPTATISEPAPTAPVGLESEPGTPSSVNPHPTPRSPGISSRALNLLLGGALVLAVAGVAFAVGRMTAPAQTITAGAFPNGGFNGNGQGGPGNGGFQGRPGNGQGGFGIFGAGGATIEGTVEAVSDTTLTLRTADGQTIQIALSDTTTYHSQSDATASDVVTGGQVLVRLNLRRGDGAAGGPQASAGPGGGFSMSAGDITVVP